MIIGVYYPEAIPESFRVCVENISAEIEKLGARIELFSSDKILAKISVDCLWDPRCGGGNPPAEFLLSQRIPCVVTVHGLAPMEIPFEYGKGLVETAQILLDNWQKKRTWARVADSVDAVVAVSEFGKKNIIAHLPLRQEKIFVCRNAINKNLFRKRDAGSNANYLLHISNNEPRKNLKRIVAAYESLDLPQKPELWLKIPDGSWGASARNIRIISRRLDDEEIADLYAGAVAFIFPSLYEGFGLPIVEAMACGCPVITSNGTACSEVAGNAAIEVDPRSVSEIAASIQQLCLSEDQRAALIAAGFERAKEFDWGETAKEYLKVFEAAARGKSTPRSNS